MLITDLITDKKFISVKEDKKANIKTYHSPYLDYYYEYDYNKKNLDKIGKYGKFFRKRNFRDELFLIFYMKFNSYLSYKFIESKNPITMPYRNTSVKNVKISRKRSRGMIFLKNRKMSVILSKINDDNHPQIKYGICAQIIDNSHDLETILKELI